MLCGGCAQTLVCASERLTTSNVCPIKALSYVNKGLRVAGEFCSLCTVVLLLLLLMRAQVANCETAAAGNWADAGVSVGRFVLQTACTACSSQRCSAARAQAAPQAASLWCVHRPATSVHHFWTREKSLKNPQTNPKPISVLCSDSAASALHHLRRLCSGSTLLLGSQPTGFIANTVSE